VSSGLEEPEEASNPSESQQSCTPDLGHFFTCILLNGHSYLGTKGDDPGAFGEVSAAAQVKLSGRYS